LNNRNFTVFSILNRSGGGGGTGEVGGEGGEVGGEGGEVGGGVGGGGICENACLIN